MNQEFKEIVLSIDSSHYCDDERWYRDVLKTDYEIITKDGFGILIEFYYKFGFKIGFSRGGVRFDKKTKSVKEFQDFLLFLQKKLHTSKYLFVGIDHLEPEDEYNQFFPINNYREHIQGTVLLYPQKDWIKKFNSKKRYDLVYASKKGVEVVFFSNYEPLKEHKGLTTLTVDVDTFYKLCEETIKRQGKQYAFPPKKVFENIFNSFPFILTVAIHNGTWVAYNLSLLNPRLDIVERVFAGANEDGLKLRAPSFIEVEMVASLAELGIGVYDLWGIQKGQGFTEFKESIGDKIVHFRPFSVFYVRKTVAKVVLFLLKYIR